MNENTYDALQAFLSALRYWSVAEKEISILKAIRELQDALSGDETIIK